MEFLVEFVVVVPPGTPESDVDRRRRAEAVAARKLADDGHLVRLWRAAAATGTSRAIGIYEVDDQQQLDGLLEALPLYDWMQITVTALERHPNDRSAAREPAAAEAPHR
jgi:muconolactone D-isomerase